jgi:redox-sensitive bicupin YhaK (pirin superfamily)
MTESEIRMIILRPSEERGHFNHGWLNTYHTFSFGDYFDPAHMGIRTLRVINEDRVQPGQGFPPHSHRDMEIITVVLEGALEHEDSMGNGSVIRPGEVQRMTAGRGVRHSEYNPSASELVHLLQIWLLPDRSGLEPGYQQAAFRPEQMQNRLLRIASHTGDDGALTIHQDVNLYLCTLDAGPTIEYSLAPGRHAWLQATRGEIELNGRTARAGDGAAVSDESRLLLRSRQPSQFLLFDLA